MHRTLIPKLRERATQTDVNALADVAEMLLDNIKELETVVAQRMEREN